MGVRVVLFVIGLLLAAILLVMAIGREDARDVGVAPAKIAGNLFLVAVGCFVLFVVAINHGRL